MPNASAPPKNTNPNARPSAAVFAKARLLPQYASSAPNSRSAYGRALGLVFFGGALAFGTHYLGGLAGIGVAAMAMVGVATNRCTRRDGAKLVAASACGGLVWVPWLATIYWQHQRLTVWGDEARTSLRELAELPVRLLLVDIGALPAAWLWTSVLCGGLVWLGLAFGMWRGWRAPAGIGSIAAALTAAIAVALVLALVAKNFLPRYLTAVAPLVVLVMAVGLAALPGRWTGALVGGCIVVAMSALLVAHRSGNRREDYRSAVALLEQRWQPDDAIVAVSGTPELFSQALLRHYLRARPDIIASLRSVADWPLQGGEPRAVHLVYRVNSYADSDLRRVVAGRREVFAAPVHVKVQYRELQ